MKKSNIDQWICATEQWSSITREKLEELQLFRLNQRLKQLKEREGFYKGLPEHLDTLEELQTLPFTTSEQLSAYPGKFLLTSQSEVSRVISGATSGTTGPAKRVFYTEQDTAYTVSFFAAGIGEMVNPGDRVLIAFPFSGPFGLGDLIEQAVLSLGARSIRGTFGQTYEQMCRQIAETRPNYYIGFPVALLSLMRMYKTCVSPDSESSSSKSDHFPIKRALISGDACPKGVIRALEQGLGHSLYPHYGSRETGLSGAITCPAHEGMHLKENHVIAEILDENLQPVPDGTLGELVITTIGLEAMPLIRYRTGDRARFFPTPCPCGSMIKRLDMVSRLEEKALFMEELDSLLFSLENLVDYQVRETEEGLSLNIYSLTGDCSSKIATLLSSKKNISLNEKKCLPEDTFLYPGKRYIYSAT